MENVVLTPHIASATRETRLAMGMLVVSALRAVLLEDRIPRERRVASRDGSVRLAVDDRTPRARPRPASARRGRRTLARVRLARRARPRRSGGRARGLSRDARGRRRRGRRLAATTPATRTRSTSTTRCSSAARERCSCAPGRRDAAASPTRSRPRSPPPTFPIAAELVGAGDRRGRRHRLARRGDASRRDRLPNESGGGHRARGCLSRCAT